MRHTNMVFRLGLFVLLLAVPITLTAQEALTQTFTSADGTFTMDYPEGWQASEEDDLIRFSTDQAFMQVNYFDYGERVTALEILEIGTPTALGFSEPEELVVGGYPAVRAVSEDQHHTVINFCNGIMALAIGYVQPGDMPTFEATFAAMLDTIRYEGGDAAACVTPFDALAPITSANAAQVAQVMTLGDETVAVEHVTFSADGKLLAAATLDGSVTLWDAATGETHLVLDGHRQGALSAAFGAGDYQIATGGGNGQVWLWDTTTGETTGRLQRHSSGAESIAFIPDGFLIASGALDGSVRLYDMLDGNEQAPLAEEDDQMPVTSVAFSPDGTLLAAGGGNTIRLWDVEAGTVQSELETEISDIASIAFSPDGTRLVYGGADSTAWVWDMADDHHALLEGHAQAVFALAFSTDGRLIVSGDQGTVRLWDAATGENLVALASPAGEAVNSVAFSPDGTLLASGGASGGVVLWGAAADGGTAQDTAASEDAAASESPDETASETTETTAAEASTTSATTCTITAPGNANLRSGPGTNFERAASIAAGQTAEVDGQATGADGMTWYRLTDGTWARSDVVNAPAECADVPAVTP